MQKKYYDKAHIYKSKNSNCICSQSHRYTQRNELLCDNWRLQNEHGLERKISWQYRAAIWSFFLFNRKQAQNIRDRKEKNPGTKGNREDYKSSPRDENSLDGVHHVVSLAPQSSRSFSSFNQSWDYKSILLLACKLSNSSPSCATTTFPTNREQKKRDGTPRNRRLEEKVERKPEPLMNALGNHKRWNPNLELKVHGM